MTTQEIAKKLAAYCIKGDWNGAHNELYAYDAKSTEPFASAIWEQKTQGLDKLKIKGTKFDSMIEKSFGNQVSTPLITDSVIAFVFTMDADMVGMGRTIMTELCVYEVENEKIISEQFFYAKN
ncbi:MAG: SnoaL-like domain-containing protein [Ferruginibacter sp.]